MDKRTPRKRGERIEDTPAEQQRFLDAYAETAILSSACRVIGLNRKTVYAWQERDEQFALRFNQARAEADDKIRQEIHRRAIEGTDKPVYQGGRLVGHIREFSDTLLIFLAKSRMPEFREKQQIEHTGDINISLKALKEIRQRADHGS